MSRKGECHDNAVAASFFSTLKTELVDDEDYRTRSEAKQSIFECIEVSTIDNEDILIRVISAQKNMSGLMPFNKFVR